MQPRRFLWLDVLIAVCAAGGLTASTLYGVQVRASMFAASDFKTLYASVWCFAHRMDAYSIANLQRVFELNSVVQPEKWYGHAPVYPWTTLALLTPLAAIRMVPAAYVVTILSGAVLAAAIAMLMRYAANSFDLGPLWRIAIAGLCASGPLLAFGMGMANVSLAASALCFVAFVQRKSVSRWPSEPSRWIPSVALAVAFLLKPHLAAWVGVGMFLLPERASRAVVARTAVVIAGFVALTAGAMVAMGTIGLQTRSYLAMLSAESSAGASMNATSREVLPVVSQITSFQSIVGFWIANPMIRVGLTCGVLIGLGFLVVRQTQRVDSERGALLAIGAWCALGMLATYHRAHDAVVLLIVVPWVVDRVRRTPLAWHVWAVAAFYCAMSASADFPLVERWVAALPAHSLTAFVLLRQVGLADCLLLSVLLLAMGHERVRHSIRVAQHAGAEELDIAA